MEKRSLINTGLLVLRLGIGISFIIHGAPSFFGGPDVWQALGESGMGALGLSSGLTFWGFMAAFAAFFGGIFLIIGFLTRPFSILLLITTLVALAMHISQGDGFTDISHPLELAFVFIFLIIAGPGKFSARRLIDPFKRKWFM
ncbi:MAG: DoxX family protein [Verrucomicrobiota bacterium]